MEIKIKKKIGDVMIEASADDKDPRESLVNLAMISGAPTVCGKCGKDNVTLDVNKNTSDKGTFTFVKVVCNDCEARAQLGEYKAGGYYWKEWEINTYKKDG